MDKNYKRDNIYKEYETGEGKNPGEKDFYSPPGRGEELEKVLENDKLEVYRRKVYFEIPITC